MPFRYLLPRILYYRVHTLSILFVLIILTSYAALHVIYSDAIKRDYVTTRLENATSTDFEIVLRDSTRSIDPSIENSLQRNLGDLFERYQATDRTLGVICGINYPEPFHCYQVATIHDIEAFVTVAEGALPSILPETNTSNLETPRLQAVIMQPSAEFSDHEVGDLVYFGQNRETTIPIEISGFISPINPDDLFWELQTNVTDGILTPVNSDLRLDLVLIVPLEEFQAIIAPQYEDSVVYTWRIVTDPSTIEPGQLMDIQSRLLQFEQDFYQTHPDGQIDNSLLSLVNGINAQIEVTMVNVTVLSLTIIFILVIQVFYIASRLLHVQESEWMLLKQQGATLRQKLWIQTGTFVIPALMAILIAPFIATALIEILSAKNILLSTDSSLQPFTLEAILWCAIAGIVALCAIIFAVWIDEWTHEYMANSSSSLLTDYFFDGGFITLGIVLLLRAYFINSPNLSASIEALLTNPTILAETVTSQQNTPDPLNLLGPMLVATGLLIFSLRFFSLIRRFWGTGTNSIQAIMSIKRFATPLLIVMAVMLMATLGLILQHSNTNYLREVAFTETGGDLRVEFERTETDVPQIFATVDGAQVTPILSFFERNPAPSALIAVDPASFSIHSPDYANSMERISHEYINSGLALPENTIAINLQVRDQAAYTGETDLQIEVTIEDYLGIKERLRFEPVDTPTRDTYIQYTLQIPAPIQSPWRITDIHFRTVLASSSSFESFLQAIFIDNLTAVTSENEVIIEDFEVARLPEWEIPNGLPREFVAIRLTTLPFNGEGSLRVGYQVLEAENRNPQFNTIPLNLVRSTPVPIIISESLAEAWGNQENNRNPLPVGYQGERTLSARFGGIILNYEVVDILADFPTFDEDTQFIIAPANRLWILLNRNSQPDNYFHWNQAWIHTENSLEIQEALQEVNFPYDVIEASTIFVTLRDDLLSNLFMRILFAGTCLVGLSALLVVVIHYSTQPIADALDKAQQSLSAFTLVLIAPYIPGLIFAIGVSTVVTVLSIPFLTFYVSKDIQLPASHILLLSGLIICALILLSIGIYRYLHQEDNHELH